LLNNTPAMLVDADSEQNTTNRNI